jgi:hypothetical protein
VLVCSIERTLPGRRIKLDHASRPASLPTCFPIRLQWAVAAWTTAPRRLALQPPSCRCAAHLRTPRRLLLFLNPTRLLYFPSSPYSRRPQPPRHTLAPRQRGIGATPGMLLPSGREDPQRPAASCSGGMELASPPPPRSSASSGDHLWPPPRLRGLILTFEARFLVIDSNFS